MNHPRILGLLLLLAAPASAQTMLDTTTSIGVQNTLNSVSTPSLPNVNLPSSGGAGAAAQNAAADAKAAVTVTPLTDAQREALIRAQATFREGKHAAARDAFEALTRQNYTNPEPHFGLALALFALNNDKGAEFELRQFMALAPTSFEGPYNLGVLAARSGNHDEALRLFTQAVTLMNAPGSAQPGSVQASPTAARQVLEALAAEQTRKGDYAALSVTLAQITALAPGDPKVAYRLAQARALSGQGTAALPDLYALLARDPANPAVPMLLADIYVTQGLSDRALRELSSALPRMKSGSDRSALLLHRARLLAGAGDSKNAVLAAQEATREDARNSGAFQLLGELRVLRNDRPGALSAYLSAVKLAPRDSAARLGLGSVRLALGRYAEARNDAALVIRMNPEAPVLARALYLQGVAAYGLKDYDAARTALRSSQLRAPGGDTALWLGLTAYAQKDYPAAVSALSESVKLNPTPTARQNLASALLAVSRYPEAEAILRGLVSEDARNAEGWYLLGLAQRSQGRAADAKQAFRTAVNLGHTKARGAL